jgi:hypothetical protein
MRMTIRATPNRPDLTICQDIGIGRSLVFRSFLSNFKDVEIKQAFIAKIAGYLDCGIKLKEWATWIYYLLGVRKDGMSGLAKLYGGV